MAGPFAPPTLTVEERSRLLADVEAVEIVWRGSPQGRRELAFAFAHAAARMGLDLGVAAPPAVNTSIDVTVRGIPDPHLAALVVTEIVTRLGQPGVGDHVDHRGVNAIEMTAIRMAVESATHGAYGLSGVVHVGDTAPYIVYADPVLKP